MKVINAEMADIATSAITEARHVAVNARRCLNRAGENASAKAAALVAELGRTANLLEKVAEAGRPIGVGSAMTRAGCGAGGPWCETLGMSEAAKA